MKHVFMMIAVVAVLASCNNSPKKETVKENLCDSTLQAKVAEYAWVKLTSNVSVLSEKERQIIPLMIEAAKIIDDIFWMQAFGDKTLLDTIADPCMKDYAMINYGPWDRLDDLKPFVSGYGEKPKGAGFYPIDMTEAEFDALENPDKNSEYTILRRKEDGTLEVVWYKDFYKEQLSKVITLMDSAIALAEDPGLKKYLEERVKAFQTDDYFASDMAWMDMKGSKLDFVIGPIENYEDRLMGRKAAYESYVLIKDEQWSQKLAKYTEMLPKLQKELPCAPQYKKEVPGTDSDLNAYDVVYYAGDCNSGSKTIAINLPNDERVHLKKGSRRLQLKNAMAAKFDNIMIPIANLLIDSSQLVNIKFDAFFSNVMFHEVAHGLGIKNTITGKGTVRNALKEQYSAWEEAKADILGLFMVEQLISQGEVTDCSIEDSYITFIAGILRSVRFGAASAHGKANMMAYNFFEKSGAFTRTNDGKYLIDIEKSKIAAREWAALILKVEGEGDYQYATDYLNANIIISNGLKADLDKIGNARIPRDIRFIQGAETLGL
jgi:uncharacterized lipoprotein NlpE involved in copper resistance